MQYLHCVQGYRAVCRGGGQSANRGRPKPDLLGPHKWRYMAKPHMPNALPSCCQFLKHPILPRQQAARLLYHPIPVSTASGRWKNAVTPFLLWRPGTPSARPTQVFL